MAGTVDSPASVQSGSDTESFIPTPAFSANPVISSPTIESGNGSPSCSQDESSSHATGCSEGQGIARPARPSRTSSFASASRARSLRAAAPPPIKLGNPEGGTSCALLHSLAYSQQNPFPPHEDQNKATKGLNISFVGNEGSAEQFAPDFTVDVESTPGDHDTSSDEVADMVHTMLLSPARANTSGFTPSSPAWPSLEITSPRTAGSSRYARVFDSPKANVFSPGLPSRVSPAKPLAPEDPKSPSLLSSPSGPMPPSHGSPIRSSNRQSKASPMNTIHARNLSLFFPQPGQAQQASRTESEGDPMVGSRAVRDKSPFAGTGDWSFGGSRSKPRQPAATSDAPISRRRGHHHKHSLSHNFFSFLDPTVTNPALAASRADRPDSASFVQTPVLLVPKSADAPQPVPMPLHSVDISLETFALSPLPKSADPMTQLLASFAVLQFLIGASIWVEGQIGGWKCLVAVGYFLVFDALGVAVGVFARGGDGWRSVRRPFGTTRLMSLLYFSQSIYLVFAGVYIAKESIEQVVLGSNGHQHGGHGHGSNLQSSGPGSEDRPFPHLLLALGVVGTAFGGGVMHTHAELVDAVGSLFLTHRWLQNPLVRRYPHILANPFSLGVAGASFAILVGGIVIPAHSRHTFDALASLCLATLTAALSIPPSKEFGRILLQTAPSSSSLQIKSLDKALKDLRVDPRIIQLSRFRCWAITAGSAPPPGQPSATPPFTPTASRQNSFSGPQPSPPPSPHHPGQRHGHSLPFQLSQPGTAWHSPMNSPTVGEFGGMHASQYPSLSKQSEAPLVINANVVVGDDVSDKDIIDITKTVYTRLRTVCPGPGRAGLQTGPGEVAIAVCRLSRSL